MKKKSDFGKGFIYNLVLFAKHWGSLRSEYLDAYDKSGLPRGRAISLWFYGASDHFYELKIPEKWQEHEIGKLATELQDFALNVGHGSRMMDEVSEKEFEKFFEDLERLTRLIDKELGVEDTEATWR